MGMMGSQSGRPVSGVSEVGRDGPRQRDRNRREEYPKGSGGSGAGPTAPEPAAAPREEDVVELSEAVQPAAGEPDEPVAAPVSEKPLAGGLDIQA